MRKSTIHSDMCRSIVVCFLVVTAWSLCPVAGGVEDANLAADPNSAEFWWQWTQAEPNDPDLTGSVYWTDKDRGLIQRRFLAGGSVMTLLTREQGLQQPYGLAIDRLRNRLYWADMGVIYSARLDGTDIKALVSGLTFPADLALHAGAGHLYWTDQTAGLIQRLDLERGEVETLLTGLSQPYYLALDIHGGMLYWTDTDRPGVYCGSMDDNDVRALATEDLDGPWGIGLITTTPDLDMDTDVDSFDLRVFLQHWLNDQVSWTTGWCAGRDLNADGIIDLRDFSKFAQSWAR